MSVVIRDARRLADFMSSLDVYSHAKHFQNRSAYNHIGALLTDIVLQSGLNYKSVVQPRVKRVLDEFFYVTTTPLLRSAVRVYGVEYFLNWKNGIKIQRFSEILAFVTQAGIDDENSFRDFLTASKNRERFLTINGVGPKTVDYALKLMGVECVAVDRHVLNFIKEAGIQANEYNEVKRIVEYAADLLSISRTGVDNFIWATMSKANPSNQMTIQF